jgi:hypothetical protein
MQNPMHQCVLTDFYRGWMVEVRKQQGGFQSICCSPIGEKLSDRSLYTQDFEARQAAIALIDRLFACYALKQVLRDMYELGQLDRDNWQRLSQSLSKLP